MEGSSISSKSEQEDGDEFRKSWVTQNSANNNQDKEQIIMKINVKWL